MAALLYIYFRILPSKNITLAFSLPIEEFLVASFSKNCALITRKYMVKHGISFSNWSEIFKSLWSHSSFFDLELWRQKCKVSTSFTSKMILSGYFYSETGSLTSSKNMAEQYMNIPKWSRKYKLLWLLFRFHESLDKLTCCYNWCHRQNHYLRFFKEFSKIFIIVIFLYFYEFMFFKN